MDDEIVLIKKPHIHEKILIALIKIFGYGFGGLTTLPHFIFNGFVPTARGFSPQSYAYNENGLNVYRSLEAKEKLVTSIPGIHTLNQYLINSANKYPDRFCLGKRRLISTDKEYDKINNKTVVKYSFGDFLWKTYSQVLKEMQSISQHLIDMGFNSENKMALFANTSQEWITMAISLTNISSPLVTVYPSLSDDSILYAFNITEIRGVMVDEKTLPRLLKVLDKLPFLKYIICMTHIEKLDNDPKLPEGSEIKFMYIESLYKYSGKTDSQSQAPKDGNDLAIIMFTSGSTGVPKGVMISHNNIIAVSADAQNNPYIIKPHVYAAFLPSSHIFEFFMEFTMILFGSTLGFCTPLTLLDTSPMIQAGSTGDLVKLRPTLMIAVPLFLERVEKGVLQQLRLKSRIKQLLFQTCYEIKLNYRYYGFDTPLLDRIVFKPLRNLMGGRVELAFVGGAYISKANEDFANVCFGNFKQGYGLTETSSAALFNNVPYLTTGTAGSPMSHVEIRLVPWEEGGYNPKDPERPAGEITICGGSVTMGYYKNEELTAQSYITDPETGKRWFYTGDIGEVTKDGNIKIIDRKKDIIKLAHGEYVSLVRIEATISSNPLVDIVCILPNKSMQNLICLIIPNRERSHAFLKKQNLATDDSDMQTLLENTDVKSALLKDIQQSIGKDLNKHEIPQKYYILSDIWTPESNLITPTVKIKRSEIAKHYAHLLED